MNQFQDMTQAITTKHNDLVHKACKPLMECFGLSDFGYCKISNSGKYCYFGTPVGWSEYFAAEELYKDFPYYRHPKHLREDVVILRSTKDDSFMEVLDIAKKDFEIHQGVFILNRVDEGYEGFGFYFNSSNSEQLSNLVKELPLLRCYIKMFKKNNPYLLDLANDCQIDFAKLVGSKFFEKHPDLGLQLSNRKKFMKQIGIETNEMLSPRERELVQQLVKGYSANQIGKILFISKRTVEHHIDRVKMKLSCDSKAELIQKIRELESFHLI